MASDKTTPAPKASEERDSPASKAIKETGHEESKEKETYPNPSQKN